MDQGNKNDHSPIGANSNLTLAVDSLFWQIVGMRYDLTPGSERVFNEAAAWADGDDADDSLSPKSILMGLLTENECRAAMILARHGLNIETISKRWTRFVRSEPPQTARQLSPDVTDSLDAANERLHELPQPLCMATEHLLLGLISADHETGRWLREQGLDPDELESEIFRQYGHRPGPLPFDEREERREEKERKEGKERREEDERRDWEDAEERGSASIPLPDRIHTLRVMDAAADRAREGLRVAEDFARFILDDPHLTSQLKSLRHDLTELLLRLPQEQLIAARETQADVGTRISTPNELIRDSLPEVCSANFTRLQESLRSLEEFSKTFDADLASRFEALRYRSYTLHRAVEIGRFASERLDEARLYVLLDGRESIADFTALTESLVEAGVDMVQLREKRLDDRPLLARAKRLREITASSKTRFLMNDRADLAVLSKADGVHLGQEEISVKDARKIVGPDRLIGVSTHTIEQVRQAVLDGADYLGIGPTFPSRTKTFDTFTGVDLLRKVASEIRLPAFAIGGIDRENVVEVLSTGIRRIALSSAILEASDPTAAVAELRDRLG